MLRQKSSQQRPMRRHRLGLSDQIEALALGQQQIDLCERLDVPCFAACLPPHTLRQQRQLAPVTREHRQQPVSLALITALEHDSGAR